MWKHQTPEARNSESTLRSYAAKSSKYFLRSAHSGSMVYHVTALAPNLDTICDPLRNGSSGNRKVGRRYLPEVRPERKLRFDHLSLGAGWGIRPRGLQHSPCSPARVMHGEAWVRGARLPARPSLVLTIRQGLRMLSVIAQAVASPPVPAQFGTSGLIYYVKYGMGRDGLTAFVLNDPTQQIVPRQQYPRTPPLLLPIVSNQKKEGVAISGISHAGGNNSALRRYRYAH